MPQPTQQQVHVDAVLSNISVAYRQSATNFVAPLAFPEVPVDKQTDRYYVYNKNDWFRDEAQKRAPGTESVGSGYTLGTDSYKADVWAFHKDVDDQTRANYDNQLNADNDAVEFVMNRMLMRMERDWQFTYFKPGVWATDVTGVAAAPGAGQFLQWNDAASTPIKNIEDARRLMLVTTGFAPNLLVLGYDTYVALKNHPSIYDRLKYTTSENITLDILARFFEVDRVAVSYSVVNTSDRPAPGQTETPAFQFVMGKAALLMYVAPNPSLLQPTAGYRFTWRGVSDGLGLTVGTVRIPMPAIRSDRIESQMAWDHKVVATDMGYFFSAAVA